MRFMASPSPETDVVSLLTHDHEVLRHLTTGFEGLGQEQRAERLRDLTVNLVRHEVAEERIVYPAIRTDVLPGDAMASALIGEEKEIEGLLRDLEKLLPESDSFEAILDRVQSQVLGHMRDEELNLFPLLRRLEADVRRWELGARYLRAVRSAPTHPHPHAPDTRPGTLVAGPIAALVDRVRDAVHRSADAPDD